MDSIKLIEDSLSCFDPISLSEMESVRLMNRIDTKYAVSADMLPAILEAAQTDYFVQETEGKRIAAYDTLYYDTDSLDMYIRHHDRQLVRQKIRVRQYVDSNLTFLEIKHKNNKGRTKKKRIAVPGFDLTADMRGILHHKRRDDESLTVADFINKKSRYTWDNISPHLWTRFHRITLVNKARTERLTIDLGLVWHNAVTGDERTFDNLVIIELKRDGNVSSPMAKILIDLRIHPLKISKYCIGTALTTHNQKYNRFKAKIRKIEKILSK